MEGRELQHLENLKRVLVSCHPCKQAGWTWQQLSNTMLKGHILLGSQPKTKMSLKLQKIRSQLGWQVRLIYHQKYQVLEASNNQIRSHLTIKMIWVWTNKVIRVLWIPHIEVKTTLKKRFHTSKWEVKKAAPPRLYKNKLIRVLYKKNKSNKIKIRNKNKRTLK